MMKIPLQILLAQLSLSIACQSAVIENNGENAHRPASTASVDSLEADQSTTLALENAFTGGNSRLPQESTAGERNTPTPLPWHPGDEAVVKTMPYRVDMAVQPTPLAPVTEPVIKWRGMFEADPRVRLAPSLKSDPPASH
jgi:hypothetical protein